MRENTDQKNSEYGLFSRSTSLKILEKKKTWLKFFIMQWLSKVDHL